MNMEENATLFGVLLEKIENFSKTTIDLIKLKAIDQIAKILSNALFVIFIGLLALIFLFFLSLAFAFWINELLGKAYAGFFIVAGFYFLMMLLLIIFKEQLIKTPLVNSIITKLLK